MNDNIIQDDRHLVLIVGVGRSGTTLLQCKLNAHQDVDFPLETSFFDYMCKTVSFKKPDVYAYAQALKKIDGRMLSWGL